jgi:hypothetical protein
MNDRKGIEGVEGEAATAPRPHARHAVAWLLAAFGFLAAGVAGGAALSTWTTSIGWTVPLAGFAAYLMAFRRGMILWNPEIDRTWRQYLRVKPGASVREDTADPEATIRLLRPVPPQSLRVRKVVR